MSSFLDKSFAQTIVPAVTTTAKPTSTLDHFVLVGIGKLCAAVQALSLATRYDEALDLVESAPVPDDPSAALRLALVAADAAERRDYVRGGAPAAQPWFERLAAFDGVDTDPIVWWDVDLLRLRRAYAAQLRHPDGSAWFGPEGRDAVEVQRLQAAAAQLQASAPDDARRGWASMCAGWIADNVLGERDVGPRHYRPALEAGRAAGDDLLVFEGQRHLGDHAHDDGDHEDATERWHESTEAAARAGHLAGTLAQQLLLGVLARDAGDESAARLLVTETGRWASAIEAETVRRQSEAFLAGVDPTAPPPAAD